MAKDDFHVIACIILSYLYNCIKQGEPVDVDQLEPAYFHVNQKYFDFIIAQLFKAGYIDGVLIRKWKGGQAVLLGSDLQITMAGIEYLETNSTMEKAKKSISTMGGWVQSLVAVLQIGSMFM